MNERKSKKRMKECTLWNSKNFLLYSTSDIAKLAPTGNSDFLHYSIFLFGFSGKLLAHVSIRNGTTDGLNHDTSDQIRVDV